MTPRRQDHHQRRANEQRRTLDRLLALLVRDGIADAKPRGEKGYSWWVWTLPNGPRIIVHERPFGTAKHQLTLLRTAATPAVRRSR